MSGPRHGSAGVRTELTGSLLDRATQRWVIATGLELSVADHPWLDGPVGSPDGIGERWIAEHATRVGGVVVGDEAPGLLPDMTALDGPGFQASHLAPEVRRFYEDTSAWRMELWARWSRWAEPGGRLIDGLFARRLRQLSLPLDPLAVAYGMHSSVLAVRHPAGEHLGTVWQRTLRATGETVFGGFYGVVRRPGADRPSIRVVFPLPNGSLTVFLRPHVDANGALVLRSPTGAFGDDGAYLVVRPDAGDRAWVRRVPLPERFRVFVDADGVLRCDHELRLRRLPVLRLHYRLDPLGP